MHDAGTWEATAVWEFPGGDEPVRMTGIGHWSNRGNTVYWRESYSGVSIEVRNEGDEVVLEDGSRYPITSKVARDRLLRSLFNIFEPLALLVDQGIELRPFGEDWVGTGSCPSGPCRVRLELDRAPDGLPRQAKLTLHYPDTWVRMNFTYKVKPAS